jgi:integrase
VEVREKSIRLSFVWDGKACRETLRTGGEPMAPTPANIRYAQRLAGEIRSKIKHGTFSYADYFPASLSATSGHATTVADQLDDWLKVQTVKAPSTVKSYDVAVRWWKGHIGGVPVKALKHGAILAALATEPAWSGKTRNNKTSVLRQALELAIRDQLISANPIDGLEAAPHQSPGPDPFSLAEVEAILGDLRKHYHAQVGNYFELKFFTGLRTSESLALRWEAIDWRRQQMLISEGIVQGKHRDQTKTHTTRSVQLISRAMAALRAQKEHTFMANDWVFQDPASGKRWSDDQAPRESYWRPALRRLGIRYRSPYQTRHTYATILLMSGVTPAYGARQMGHSVEMFLRTYTRWIDGGHNELELGKVEAMLSSPEPPRRVAK